MAEPSGVLIADDDAGMRALLRRLVEESGQRVVGEASNGAEAVRLAAALQPAIVTMDLEMPVLNGAEATRAICSNGHEPPAVVIVSGSESSDLVGSALSGGARWHVAKQDVTEQLPPVLQSLLAPVAPSAHDS